MTELYSATPLFCLRNEMSNIDLVKSFLERNPKLSDEEVSLRLGVTTKKVRKARELLQPKEESETKSKMFASDNRPDVVSSPRASLEQKIRELDQAFEIAKKEFQFDPNADNAGNMNSLLASIKSTLKELNTFTDLTELSQDIINNVLAKLTQDLMIASYKKGKEIAESYREYLPKGLRYKVDEFPNEFKTAIGKEAKSIYDKAIDALELVMGVNLGAFRNSEREEPIYTKKKKKD